MVKLIRWDDIEREQLNPLLQRQYINGAGITLARFRLGKGLLIPTHAHENEQLSYVVGGALKFHLEGKDIVVCGGEVLCIPPHVPHQAEALEESYVIDIFAPPRADWARRDDAYLRG